MTQVLSVLGVAPAFGNDFSRAPALDDWRQYYTDASAALIADRYAWDLSHYGYAPLFQRMAS